VSLAAGPVALHGQTTPTTPIASAKPHNARAIAELLNCTM
jgi:hypothetical protein